VEKFINQFEKKIKSTSPRGEVTGLTKPLAVAGNEKLLIII
jgi:hypothetical protein